LLLSSLPTFFSSTSSFSTTEPLPVPVQVQAQAQLPIFNPTDIFSTTISPTATKRFISKKKGKNCRFSGGGRKCSLSPDVVTALRTFYDTHRNDVEDFGSDGPTTGTTLYDHPTTATTTTTNSGRTYRKYSKKGSDGITLKRMMEECQRLDPESANISDKALESRIYRLLVKWDALWNPESRQYTK
jgi:hypothetical protein